MLCLCGPPHSLPLMISFFHYYPPPPKNAKTTYACGTYVLHCSVAHQKCSIKRFFNES
jgi:hypothetical protein